MLPWQQSLKNNGRLSVTKMGKSEKENKGAYVPTSEGPSSSKREVVINPVYSGGGTDGCENFGF